MILIRLVRLAVLVLLGTGYGLLPRQSDTPTAAQGSIRLTETWQEQALP